MSAARLVLGINAYHAEASAAILRDGELIAAAEEERFCRIKHAAGFPRQAVRYCLQEAGADPEAVDVVAVSRNPWAHLLPRAWLALRRKRSGAVQDRLANWKNILGVRAALAESLGVSPERIRAEVRFVEHHRAHMASGFYPSGWDRAVVLSLDGFGDFLSGQWGLGEGSRLNPHGEAPFPHSLGVLYTAITQFLGFSQWGDEYKVMGLASCGRPDLYREALSRLVREAPRNAYRLDLKFFRHTELPVSMSWRSGSPTLGTLFSEEMEKLLGPDRKPGQPLEPRHADIAAALQERLETVMLRLLARLWERYRLPRLCYAGGVALNCAANGKILERTPFQEVFIQPAAHDGGTSLGAALYAAHHIHRRPRRFVMVHAGWGPGVSETESLRALERSGTPHRRLEESALCRTAARALARGKIVGWFQGRMEFGPRALGHRSLLADPRDATMRDRINERIKRRESFRPFAPSVTEEAAGTYFPKGHPDRFMLFAYPADPVLRKRIPAVIHVDGTGRLQAVGREIEPLYWNLLKAFETLSGVPVLLNTSFNEQEPIVCRPEEALDCFRRNGVDALALGPFWVEPEPADA